MPLFNFSSPLSAEAGALYHLADRVSECGRFQEISETTSAVTARSKVIVGPHAKPFDGKEYTEEELAGMLCEAQLWAPTEGGRELSKGEAVGDRPKEGGEFMLTIRRYGRPVEMEDAQDFYLWFLDRIAAFERELWDRCDVLLGGASCPELQSITRQQLAFSPYKSASVQGEYLFATHLIRWGDTASD